MLWADLADREGANDSRDGLGSDIATGADENGDKEAQDGQVAQKRVVATDDRHGQKTAP